MKIIEFTEDTISVYVNEENSEKNNYFLVYLLEKLRADIMDGIKDIAISYDSLVIHYDVETTNSSILIAQINSLASMYAGDRTGVSRIVEIPVCYDSEFGLDQHRFIEKGINKEDLVKLHSEKEYLIHMIGFLPGFPFLNDVNKVLKMERLPTPRISIPKGSVGIAGQQTGFYPTASPGGWNIIGRTPLNIDIEQDRLNIPYNVGDYIKFVPITRNEFEEILKLEEENKYSCIIHERGL